MRRTTPAPLGAIAVAVLAAALLAACGGSESPDAQPAPDVTVFRGGSFDQLPRYPRSDEVGPSTGTAGVVSQSFSVRNASPREIVEYYGDNLRGWAPIKPIEPVGADTFRGTWSKGDRLLQVSAGPAPTLDRGAPPGTLVTQYSLQLGPPSAFP